MGPAGANDEAETTAAAPHLDVAGPRRSPAAAALSAGEAAAGPARPPGARGKGQHRVCAPGAPLRWGRREEREQAVHRGRSVGLGDGVTGEQRQRVWVVAIGPESWG